MEQGLTKKYQISLKMLKFRKQYSKLKLIEHKWAHLFEVHKFFFFFVRKSSKKIGTSIKLLSIYKVQVHNFMYN